jgi:hypothetical protein
MSLFSDGIALGLGETLIGTDDGRLINTRVEGREAMVSHEDFLNAGLSIADGNHGIRSRVRIMRNTTGGVLYAGEIVKIDPAAGIAGFGKASAKASANNRLCAVVDPLIGAQGVADDDLFLAFIEGPCLVLAPAAGVALASAGLPLVAGASGRAAAGGDTAGSSKNVIGTFLTGIMLAAANEDMLLECVLAPVGW